jgi:nucleotidyltransferase substrate binding protein (TIGR01987 family)
MELDLTPFNNALKKLIEGLERYELDTSDDQVRDGLIKRFEFTYELAHKMMRRYLAESSANIESINELSFQGLIRTASDKNLIKGDWSDWSTYREMRGKTSHTYDESIAVLVVEGIPAFIEEASHLQKVLTKKCLN